MLGSIKVRGIIVRQTDFQENDRIFTILTQELGTVRAIATGVRRKKNALSSCRLFLYAEFVLFEGRNLYHLDAVTLLHDFFDISKNVEGFALSCYIVELAQNISVERVGDTELIRLILNSLYCIEEAKFPILHIKTVCEWRLSKCAGLMPALAGCAICHRTDEITAFSVSEGKVYCIDCAKQHAVSYLPINQTAYRAMCYILSSPPEKAFSFSMNRIILKEIGKISESYIIYHLSSKVTTLSYFYEVYSDD